MHTCPSLLVIYLNRYSSFGDFVRDIPAKKLVFAGISLPAPEHPFNPYWNHFTDISSFYAQCKHFYICLRFFIKDHLTKVNIHQNLLTPSNLLKPPASFLTDRVGRFLQKLQPGKDLLLLLLLLELFQANALLHSLIKKHQDTDDHEHLPAHTGGLGAWFCPHACLALQGPRRTQTNQLLSALLDNNTCVRNEELDKIKCGEFSLEIVDSINKITETATVYHNANIFVCEDLVEYCLKYRNKKDNFCHRRVHEAAKLQQRVI